MTDQSYANINAILDAQHLGPLGEYIDELWLKSSDENIDKPIMKLCYSHIMHNASTQVKKHLPFLRAKVTKPNKVFLARMALAETSHELCATFRNIAT